MAGFFTDLAKPFVERGINRAIEESRYICCFRCIAEEYEQERVWLEAERSTMIQRVKVANRRGEDVQVSARHWEEEADKLIDEDTKTMQKCFFGLSPNCIWRYRRGKELADKTKLIKRMMERGENLQNVGLPSLPPGIERYSSQHYISFKSREFKYKQLLNVLMNESNYLTGLHGMGGTGKTTLAMEVGKQLKKCEQFALVIHTTVSYTPDIKQIQDDIAGSLGLKWEDCNEPDRPKKLWSRLTNGEKILVILDDVWDADLRDLNPPLDFDAIGIPERDNHKGCRVLVVTRSKRLLDKMDCDAIIELDLLSEEDAWSMFQQYAGLSNNSSTGIIERGRKIAKECKRLPVAIAPIASSLKGQHHREEWDVTLKSLKNSLSSMRCTVDEHLIGIYNCLKFSYDYMKDEKAKGLFLLCSLFPEDEVISVETLTRFGIAASIFGDEYGSYDDARSQVVVAKNKLINSCLLLETENGSVKMHDLVREVAQWIANKEIQTVNVSNKYNKSLVERNKNIKYLLCECKDLDVFSCRFDGSKLEILIVNFFMDEACDNMEVTTVFFEKIFPMLRALHLNNTNWRYRNPVPLSLPQSIQSMTNIRSLMVDRVNLGDISILGNLQRLETLDLFCCTINELPCEITKLENLKMLKLKVCHIIRNNPFEVIVRCSSLEELYFIDSFNSFCRDITFPNLQRYYVHNYFWWVRDNELQSKCVVFNGDGDVGFFSEATFKYCMRTAEVLQLRGIKRGWRNIIPEIVPIDEGMNDLVVLCLDHISQLQCLIDTIDHSHVPNVFSKLVVLILLRMENLVELCNGPLLVDSLKNLEEIEIVECNYLRSFFKCKLNLCNLKCMTLIRCPMVVSLFQLSTSQSLVLLEDLRIENCMQLENIIINDDERIGDDESGEPVVDNNNSRCSMFPKLKSLRVYRCSRLEFILSFVSARDLPVLEDMRIYYCDMLKFMFSQYVELSSLKKMKLYSLPQFIDIFPECQHPMSLSVKGSSSTSIVDSKAQTQMDHIICKNNCLTHICCYGDKYRHKLKTTTKLPSVFENQPDNYSITLESNSYNIWERAQCFSRQSQILCNIKKIELLDISKIKSVFPLSIAPRMLLETLIIQSCEELKHVVVDTEDDNSGTWINVFPKLKELEVESCAQMEYIIGHYAHDDQNPNEIHLHLSALEDLKLTSLPSLMAMAPRKYRTTYPLLTRFELYKCSHLTIADIVMPSISRTSTNIKGLSGNVEQYCCPLKRLEVDKTKVENIFCFSEINGQQMNLELQIIQLCDMPVLKYLCVGPKNYFALQNLIKISIVRCEKLEIIFSTSIIRWLPQLLFLMIKECKELKHVIEDDGMENQEISNSHSQMTCFPKLKVLAVIKCDKLKCVFSVSINKRLPELKALMISEAQELEEIFKSEVEIQNLKVVVFDNLPNLGQTQGIQFHGVQIRFVQNCQKLSLTTSASRESLLNEIQEFDLDYEMLSHFRSLTEQLAEDSQNQDTRNENASTETTKDFAAGNKVQATSFQDDDDGQIAIPSTSVASKEINVRDSQGTTKTNDFPVETVSRQMTSSQTKSKQAPGTENVAGLDIPPIAILPKNSEHEQWLMNQTYPPVETGSTIKPSQENNSLKEIEDKSIQKSAASKNTNSETRNEPPLELAAPNQKGTNSESIRSPSGLSHTSKCETSLHDDGEGQIAMPSFSTAMEDVDVQGSLKSIETQVQGNPSQIVEDLNSPCLVTLELEQLVLEKHLESKNLSLLIDFLVKHPSVCLTDNSLSKRYKGYAYNCLAELLKFLQTHSVLDVLGSSHSEFVESLQDTRRCGFDKEWLDGVERRALFSGLQFSQDQEAILQKLLESKRILTQHVEGLRHQLASSEAFLESVIQKEAQVLETRTALSAPLGY